MAFQLLNVTPGLQKNTLKQSFTVPGVQNSFRRIKASRRDGEDILAVRSEDIEYFYPGYTQIKRPAPNHEQDLTWLDSP